MWFIRPSAPCEQHQCHHVCEAVTWEVDKRGDGWLLGLTRYENLYTYVKPTDSSVPKSSSQPFHLSWICPIHFWIYIVRSSYYVEHFSNQNFWIKRVQHFVQWWDNRFYDNVPDILCIRPKWSSFRPFWVRRFPVPPNGQVIADGSNRISKKSDQRCLLLWHT